MLILCALTLLYAVKAGSQELAVERSCHSASIKPVVLKYRDTTSNLAKVRKLELGSNALASYLKKYYKDFSSKDVGKNNNVAHIANEKFILASKLKDLFLKYDSSTSKLADPSGYRDAVLKSFEQLVPRELNDLSWFLGLKDSEISLTSISPAPANSISEIYGAVTRITSDGDKNKIEVLFSNEDSEAIPYLIPLIGHEFIHAKNYKNIIKVSASSREFFEIRAIEEAQAFDRQMKIYVKLAKSQPELFCDWLYSSYSYGDIVVPLSWTMASMEKSMRDGKYLVQYLKMGTYKGQTYLLDSTGNHLSQSLTKKIEKLNLEYVK